MLGHLQLDQDEPPVRLGLEGMAGNQLGGAVANGCARIEASSSSSEGTIGAALTAKSFQACSIAGDRLFDSMTSFPLPSPPKG